MTVQFQDLDVTWFGYATTRIETPEGFVAYLDPGRYGVLTGEWTPVGGGNPKEAAHPRATNHQPRDADLVCVTHDHHYDSDAIERVAGADCTVVVYENVDPSRIDRDVAPLDELPGELVRVEEEDYVTVDAPTGDVDVWSLPAYNEEGGPHAKPGGVTHPKGFGVGYRLSIGGTSVFWPGDSDALDAFAELEVDLFLANVGGSVVSNRREAADLAERMDPGLVLPVHYNTLDSLQTDSGAFASDVAKRGVPVVLDEGGWED